MLDALSWESGFLKTFFDLLTRPKVLLQAYLRGATRTYTNPITFLVVVIAISWVLERLESVIRGAEVAPAVSLDAQVFLYFNITCMILITAFIHKWFFQSPSLNFTERLIVATYVFTGALIASTLIDFIDIPIQALFPDYDAILDENSFVISTVFITGFYFYGSFHGPGMKQRSKATLMTFVSACLLFPVYMIHFVLDHYFGIVLISKLQGIWNPG